MILLSFGHFGDFRIIVQSAMKQTVQVLHRRFHMESAHIAMIPEYHQWFKHVEDVSLLVKKLARERGSRSKISVKQKPWDKIAIKLLSLR